MPTGVYLRTLEMNTSRGIKISAGKKAAHFHFTDESKERMSQSALARKPMSSEARSKISQALRGEKHYLFKGQKTSYQGYVYIYQSDNPRAGKTGYIRRADLVMEQMIERPLTIDEIVDHRNKIRDDDRPENLRLFSNFAEHTRFHALSGDLFGRSKSNFIKEEKDA